MFLQMLKKLHFWYRKASLNERMHSHIGCICLTFLHCAFSNVYSNRLNEFFSTVHFEMSLWRTWIRAGKFALIAFIWFFSTVFFKCLLKVIWWEQANLHCLHLFNFSPLWIIKCLLKDSLDSNPSSCSSGLTMSRSKSMIDPLSFDWKIPNNWIKYEWTALKKQKI